MKTEQIILAKALEMFNERGIEYVGLRELAAVLEMRVSNITYYFPTKDDLVYQLSQELNQLNSVTIVEHERLTIKLFLEMLHTVFLNHVKYRCLLLSFVHLMAQNKIMAAKYKETQSVRNATLKSNIAALGRSGYIKLSEEVDTDFLISTLALINRFWISEAAISNQHLTADSQIKHYLHLVAKLLVPYATSKGKREISEFLEVL